MASNKKEPTMENSIDFFNFCSGVNRLPIYEIICERFMRQFRVSLSNWIRMISTLDYTHEMLSFRDWVNRTEIPRSMCVYRLNKLCGPMIVSFKQDLAYGIIDAVLGGSGKEIQDRNKEFTQIELTLMRDIYNMIEGDWGNAFHPVAPIDPQYIRQEINPHFIGIVPPDSKVMVTTFKVSFENVESSFEVVMPYSTLFPIRDALFVSHK